MTAIGILSVSPVTEGSMATEVAKAVAALKEFEVDYETTAMGTIVEADSVDEIFAAAAAAHDAVHADRVSTWLKIDDKRTWEGRGAEKVNAVEEELGRPAKSQQPR